MIVPVASLKYPHITSISHSTSRTKDWDDIITGHAEETFARTWSMQSKKIGKYTLGFAEDIKGKGKERPPLGSCKVSALCASILHSLYLTFIVGCLCHSLREFRDRRLFHRSDPYVESSIWDQEKDFRRRLRPG